MAGARQPTALVELKGKKHFTKAELEERRNAEVNADTDNIVPPDYLTEKQAGEFFALANELKRCEIMTNLDCDALARFVVARSDYADYVKLMRSIPKTVDNLQELKEADKLKRGAFLDCIDQEIISNDMIRKKNIYLKKLGEFYYSELDIERLRREIRRFAKELNVNLDD